MNILNLIVACAWWLCTVSDMIVIGLDWLSCEPTDGFTWGGFIVHIICAILWTIICFRS